tara:strand:- start:1260 stop:2453 length:1194 start_codon:yes stop_codon:yes gene_type:complete
MSKDRQFEPVIIEAVRTPFGRRGGALRNVRPDELLARTIQEVLQRAGMPGENIGDVIAGCVSQAGEQGGNIARQVALLAGLPAEVPGVSLNRMCGSSQYAMHAGAQAVAAGDLDFVMSCGVESMSRVPMFLDLTLGEKDFTDFENLHPGIRGRFDIPHQIESAERIAERWSISRDELDSFAIDSHARAERARSEGLHAEIFTLSGIDKEGNPLMLDADEGIRAEIDIDRVRSMEPVLRTSAQGRVTAANASQMSDGAAGVLIGNRASAERLGLKVRARFLARVVVGSDPELQLTGVIPAAKRALQTAGLTIDDLDWIEVNEAFASVALCFQRELNPDPDKLNPWGGAIAHGHPLGGTGAGLMAKMLAGLEQRQGTLGMQVMCIGHGMATATIIERVH